MLATFWEVTLATVFCTVCLLLVLIVLLQKGRGGGLGGAFGGAGSSAFGTRTGDMLTWVTIVLTALFLLLAVVSSVVFRPPPRPVDPPSFDPVAPGEIGKENLVQITCPTDGATIYYTTDGAEPTEESIPYDVKVVAKVPVAVGQTLRARAFRSGWEPSPIVAETYGTLPGIMPDGQPELPDGPIVESDEVTPGDEGEPSDEPTDEPSEDTVD